MLDNDVNNDENSDHSIWKLQSSFTRKKSDKKSKTSKPTTSVNVKETIDDNSLEEQNIITCNFDEISAISGLYVDEIPPNTIYNKESLKTTRVKGHCFTKKNFRKPLICHHCAETLWGLLGTTGYICQICNYLTHEKCISQIIIPCNSILPCIITEPAPHCWSEISHYKRKFCNVCRKRLEDVQGYKCESNI